MREFHTTNPANDTHLATYQRFSADRLAQCVAAAMATQNQWRQTSLVERLTRMAALADLLSADAPRLAAIATQEMGKPLAQASKEVEKCAASCRFWLDQVPAWLADTPIRGVGGARQAFVTHQPLGVVLGIMPWNFPYWQVVRCALPALAAGNTVLIKHADNTTASALAFADLMARAGFPDGAFQILLADHEDVATLIADSQIAAVSLTGSEAAGRSVAASAGRALKKTVLELGGSDAYIVLRDADVELAARACLEARLVNSGQSCVAAKRFIIEEPIFSAFTDAFIALARRKRVGDPMDADTDVGPLSKRSIVDEVARQVQDSLTQGARALLGGTRPGGPGCYYPVTVLDRVEVGMPVFQAEVFGPVAPLIRAKDARDAMAKANASRYGLGGAIFSRDVEAATDLAARHLQVGVAVINGSVKSDAALPFGGIKASGYGRELGREGLLEFVNVKSVLVAGEK